MVANAGEENLTYVAENNTVKWHDGSSHGWPTGEFERLFSFGTNYCSPAEACSWQESSSSFSRPQNSNCFNKLRSLRSVDPRPM